MGARNAAGKQLWGNVESSRLPWRLLQGQKKPAVKRLPSKREMRNPGVEKEAAALVRSSCRNCKTWFLLIDCRTGKHPLALILRAALTL